MPSSFKSPYATSFKSAVKRGTPCGVAVQNIAKRNSTSTTVVFNSLWKAGVCDRQKFNGKWIYWPCEGGKGKSADWKNCQLNMWQCFVDWCVCSGMCTPEQMTNNCGSQQAFMNWCKKHWNKQFNGTAGRTTRSNTRNRRTSSTGRSTRSRSVSRSGSRSYRRAA